MAYFPVYQGQFKEKIGTDNAELWRVTINQDRDSAPSEVKPVVFGSTPFTIDYFNNDDIYHPIRGSRCRLNFVVTEDVTYDDFFAGGVREYEVKVEYRRESVWHTYWVGFIIPEEFNESITFTPYNVSFSATDGIALLQNEVLPDISEGNTSIFEFIRQQLKQTGLDLNIHVESGITVGTAGIDLQDALTGTTVNNFVWLNGNPEDKAERLEVLTECLTTFNCRLYQRKGAWYITNSSSITDSVTYQSYDADGASITNITENLSQSLPDDLVPTNDSLSKVFKQPYGSIECNIQNQHPIILNQNPFISEGDDFLDGYTFPNTDTYAKQTSTTSFYGERSIFTGSDASSRGDATVWFNTEFDVDNNQKYYKFELKFKVLMTLGGAAESGLVRTRLYYKKKSDTYNYWTWGFQGADANGNTDSSVESQWFFRNNISDRSWALGETKIEHTPSWQEVTIEVNAPRSGTDADDVTFGVDFLGSIPLKSDDNVGGTVATYIDDIRIQPMVEQDGDATYELVNDSSSAPNRTYSYETRLHSQNSPIFYGGLSQTAFRRGNLAAQSIERLTTQQRLNDFREHIGYYEGSFVKHSGHPFHYGDKIEFYDDAVKSIVSGMTFDPVKGEYRVQAYQPNQGTDVAATLFDYDVELTSPVFDSRANAIAYDLVVDVTNVTLPSGAGDSDTIDDFLTLNLPKVLDDDNNPVVGQYRLKTYYFPTGGQTDAKTILFYATDGYEINASNFSIRDTDSDDKPEQITAEDFEDLGTTSISLDLQIQIPDYKEEGTIVLDGEIDALSAGSVTFSVTKGTDPTGTEVSVVQEANIPLAGQEFLIAYILPTASDKEILSTGISNPTVTAYDADDNTLSGVIGTITAIRYGVGWQYIIPVSHHADLDDVGIVFGSVTLTDIASGVTTTTVTLTADEDDATKDFSIQDDDLSIPAVVGTRFQGIFEVQADNDKYFQLDSVTATIDDTDDTDITNVYVVFKSHQEYHVFVEGLTPAALAGDNSITIGATLQDTPPVNTGTISFGKATDPEGITVSAPEQQVGVTGTTEAVVYYITPTDGTQYISTAPTFGAHTDTDNVAGTGVLKRIGSGFAYTIPITYPSGTSSFTLGAVTASAGAIAAGTNITETTITVTKVSDGNQANYSIADTSLKIKAPEGSIVWVGPLQIEAASGRRLSSQPTIGSDEETFITPSGYSFEIVSVSDYEDHVWIPVEMGSSDQTGALTVSGNFTTDDDGEEVNHTIIVPANAGANTTVTLNGGTNELEIDPGDTATFTVTVEGTSGYDVSGITMNATLPDWITEEGVEDFLVDNGLTSGRRFNYTITGQSTAPDDVTFTFTGTPQEIESYSYVMTIDASDSANMKINKNQLKWVYSAQTTGTLSPLTFTVSSADAIYAYDDDADVNNATYTIEDSSGSASLGTMSITKSRSGGIFTFTVTPTIGTSLPDDGSYNGVIVVTENEAPLNTASMANFAIDKAIATSGETLKIAFTANGNVVATEGETWISSPTVTFTDRAGGYVSIPTSSLSSGKRTGTVYLKASSSDSDANALDSITIVQEATGVFVTANNYTITKSAGASYVVYSYVNATGSNVSSSSSSASVTVCAQGTPTVLTGGSVGAAGAVCNNVDGSNAGNVSSQNFNTMYVVSAAPSGSDADGIYFVT